MSVAAVLLAAGASRRYGRPKQLERINGISLVRRAAQAALDADLELLVVTGAHADAIKAELTGLVLTVVHNPQWEQGMGASIACGIKQLSLRTETHEAALLCLADQVLVGATQLQTLLAAHRAEPERVIVSAYDDAQGPPCIFPARFYSELVKLSGDKGARSILEQYSSEIARVPLPEAGLDVDVPGDYERALRILQSGSRNR